jgi:hypothetical protein
VSVGVRVFCRSRSPVGKGGRRESVFYRLGLPSGQDDGNMGSASSLPPPDTSRVSSRSSVVSRGTWNEIQAHSLRAFVETKKETPMTEDDGCTRLDFLVPTSPSPEKGRSDHHPVRNHSIIAYGMLVSNQSFFVLERLLERRSGTEVSGEQEWRGSANIIAGPW